MEPQSRHSLEPHTADLRIRVEARSVADLFAEAGRALAAVVAHGRVPPAEGEHERVELEAPDRDALLVDWLNELIFRSETGGKVYGDVRVETLSDHKLTALIRGAAAPGRANPVKAATFHGLAITETPAGATATIVLDV